MKTMLVTDHLGFCELHYQAFTDINKIVENASNEVSVSPINLSTKIMDVDTAIVNIAEIGSFYNGVLLCTNINQASEILSCSVNSRKVLYLWELDWTFNAYDYEFLIKVLCNENLDIIVRSETHQKALKALCGKDPIGIIQNFKLEKIWNLLKETETK